MGKWSDKEVRALYVVLYGMASSDGDVDRSEIKEALSHVIKKTGDDLFSYNFSMADELTEAAENISIIEAGEVLRELPPEKKNMVIEGLHDVMSADGKILKEEVKFLDSIAQILSN